MSKATVFTIIFFQIALILGLSSKENILSKLLYAQSSCSPPQSYTGCPATQNPDFNLGLHTLTPATPVDVPHTNTDPNAPQLTGLIQGTTNPTVVQTYNINAIAGVDHPESWASNTNEGVTAAGFTTNPGQTIQVPKAGQSITENGYQVLVLYADSSHITLKYTGEGDIVDGYTLYLSNVAVSSQIQDLYNQAIAGGMKQLPALGAFQNIGTALSNELIVAIRDKGAFMDPTWINDWWANTYPPGTPLPPTLLDLLKLLEERNKQLQNQCSVVNNSKLEGIFRPKPCKNCSLNVPQPTSTCAEQPQMYFKSTYGCGNTSSCGDAYSAKVDWPNNITLSLDTSKATVPFAGYKDNKNGEVTSLSSISRSQNPNNYLNDYIEGTALYDGQKYDLTNSNDWFKFYWELGVFRKLAPQEIQDDYRKNMIKKGYNYEVKGENGIVRRMQDWAAKPYPAPGGYFPPDPKSSNYIEEYKAWMETDYGKMWERIPLFTREDAPGLVTLTVEHNPGTLQTATDKGKNIPPASAQFPLAVPHLARLDEASTALNNLLMPTIENKRSQGASNTQPTVSLASQPVLLAQAETSVSDSVNDQPQLLAQADQTSTTNSCALSITRSSDGKFTLYTNFTGQGQENCGYRDVQIWHYICDGTVKTGPLLRRIYNASYYVTHPNEGTMVLDCPPNTQNVTATFESAERAGGGDACQNESIPKTPTCSCNTTYNADGTVNSTSCAGAIPLPSQPVCQSGSNINKTCEPINPLFDSNPNDPICCNTNASIAVKDYEFPISSGDHDEVCGCTEKVIIPGVGEVCTGRERTKETPKMTRQVEVRLQVPYLEDVWKKTADSDKGVFNLFRPAKWNPFPDDDAKSNLSYTVSGVNIELAGDVSHPNGDEPSSTAMGELYFPYLGGIEKTKKCISEVLLVPQELQNGEPWCDFEKSYVPSQPIGQPSGDLQNQLDTAGDGCIDPKILQGLLAVESPEYYNNPASTSCPVSPCGTKGPMQITNGWEAVNCDPNKGAICTYYCVNGTVPLDKRGWFGGWAAYSDPGMDICNLQDSLTVAGRMLKAKAGTCLNNLEDVVSIVKGVKAYYGEGYDSSQSPAANCANGEIVRNGMTYCQNVLHSGGLDSLLEK